MSDTVLVLGSAGMLGHKLVQRLAAEHKVVATVRDRVLPAPIAAALAGAKVATGLDARDAAGLERLLEEVAPAWVINAVGWIKQRDAERDAVAAIELNSMLPRRLAALAARHEFRLIQISTDCVFSGRSGPYSEDSIPDATDLYGRSKLLGEIDGPEALTLRTSFIGHELRGHLSLLDWLMKNRGGRISGYRQALFSGLTTLQFADVVAGILRQHKDMAGLWHVSSEPISKFDLLQLVNRAYALEIDIAAEDAFACDRRLDSARFRMHTGWTPPSWERMVNDLAADATGYPLRTRLR